MEYYKRAGMDFERRIETLTLSKSDYKHIIPYIFMFLNVRKVFIAVGELQAVRTRIMVRYAVN